MDIKNDNNIIDYEATESLFGSTNIAAHLYRILQGMLRGDHDSLVNDCKLGRLESAKFMVHRIKGGLKYCKAPDYEQAILNLEEAINKRGDLPLALLEAEAACVRLYAALEKKYPQHQHNE